MTREVSRGGRNVRGMNELLEREGPATLVECPWCDGPVEVVRGSSTLACADCRLTFELASDRPAMDGRGEDAPATRSWRGYATSPATAVVGRGFAAAPATAGPVRS